MLDPISISVELELATVILAAVGALATYFNHRHQKARRRQRERHHRQMVALQERHHHERLAAIRREEQIEAMLLEDVANLRR